MVSGGTIRVLLVEDHELTRLGMVTFLGRVKDVQVVKDVGSAEAALKAFNVCNPDVAVIDYGLPNMTGVELCERLLKRRPNFPVVIFTGFMSDDVLRNALDAGAKAYIYKDAENRNLLKAIRTAVKGEYLLDTKAAGRVIGWANRTRTVGPGTPLSKKETDLLRLVARGASNVEIAEILGITTNTVKTYLRHTHEKLGTYSRAEAAAIAVKRGLL